MKEEIIIQIVLNDNTEIDLTLILAVIQLHIISSINIKPNHDIFLIDQELVIEITINWPMNYSLRLIQHILMCVIHRHHFNIIGVYEQRNSTKTRMG